VTAPGPPPSRARRTALVVGLGSVDRGDDGAGPVVAALVGDELAAHGPDDVHVLEHEDPTALVDLWPGYRSVVVVDAVRSGSAPGTVTVLSIDPGPQGAALPARIEPGPAGTHGLGLAAAVELARALDRLPEHLTVVGIHGGSFGHGEPMSASVAAAVPDAVGVVMGCLEGVRHVP
jgi:hydrogenase maturation protease